MTRPSQSPCLVNILQSIRHHLQRHHHQDFHRQDQDGFIIISRSTGRGGGKSRSANHIGGNAEQQLESFQVNYGQSHDAFCQPERLLLLSEILALGLTREDIL